MTHDDITPLFNGPMYERDVVITVHDKNVKVYEGLRLEDIYHSVSELDYQTQINSTQ